jgi:hypothetical protein
MDELLGELEQAGVLDGNATGRVKAKASHLQASHMREFDRVRDIGRFEL